MTDLDSREIAILAPIIVVVMWMGVYPAPILDVMSVSVNNLLDKYNAALAVKQAAGPDLAERVVAWLK